jgi:hypothetical protein
MTRAAVEVRFETIFRGNEGPGASFGVHSNAVQINCPKKPNTSARITR